MNTEHREDAQEQADRERAWDALGAVRDHPTVRQWLDTAEASGKAGRLKSAARRRLLAASMGIVAMGLAAAAYVHWSADRFETTVGEQRDVVLADGSRVTLNTNTALTVRYSKNRRYIEMSRGEALFSVKHDAQRPFDVAAGGTLTRALGTEFNVDLRNSKVTVSVLDGAVRVMQVASSPELTAGPRDIATSAMALGKGQALELRSDKHQAREKKADIRRIDAWRARRLEFTDTPLKTAVEEFNRYSTQHIVIGTPELGSIRVSGVFRVGDGDAFLYSLREALNVEAHEAADEIVLMRARP